MMKLFNKFIILILCQANWSLQAKQPTTLFCHGIVDNHTQVNRYFSCIKNPYQAFDFQDAQQPQSWDLNSLIFSGCSLFGKPVNREKMYMGHGQDIQTLAEQIDPHTNYILYGMSRGGVAIINYLAHYNPDNIQAIILDGTPADMIDSINVLQYEIGCKFAPDRTTQETIFQFLFPAYEKSSIPPVENIQKINNKNIPIFIINSAQDTKVDISSAWKNYIAFKKAEFTNVYLLQLPTGKHGFYLQGTDQKIYVDALHNFYERHNLAYDENLEKINLQLLQPTVEEIAKKLEQHQKNLEAQYQTKKQQLQIIGAISVTTCMIMLAI